MPLLTPRRRASIGAAALLFVSFGLPSGHAADAPAQPVTTPTAAAAPADPAAKLLQIEAEARALDPAAPDAVARLRELIARLAQLTAQLASDTARLRQEVARTAARPTSSTVKPAAVGGKTAPGKASSTAGAPRTVENTTSPAGTLFAKRGLKKFHRAGCHFGERVKAEDRVSFATAALATAAGLEPCKVCRPGE